MSRTWSESTLRPWVAELFHAAGLSREDAAAVGDSLVESSLLGHDSHGLLRVLEYIAQLQSGEMVAGAPLDVLRESSGHLLCDAHRGPGQVQCRRLIDRLIEKANVVGVASGAMRQCGHTGRLGEWGALIASRGYCGLVSVNDNGVPLVVAPPGGLAARVSTNPVSLGIPTGGEPFVLDISTSAVANGKLKAARLAGRPVPEGWIQDAQGQSTTDPHVMLADPPGTLLPFGGDQAYKAFGLSLLLDMLVSGLSGGFCPPAPEGTVEFNNVLMVVWNPDLFAGREHIEREARRLVEFVRATPVKPGVDQVRLPGDRGTATRAQRVRDGVPVPDDLAVKLGELAVRLGVRRTPE